MAHETDFSFILPPEKDGGAFCYVVARLAGSGTNDGPIIFGWDFGTNKDCKGWLRDKDAPETTCIDLTRTEVMKIINALLAAVAADRDREAGDEEQAHS